MEPTLGPDAPAMKKEWTGLPTFPFFTDGMKSGKQDKTPCNEESMRNRSTFKWSFSSPAWSDSNQYGVST